MTAIALTYSTEHTTSAGHPAQYITIHDARTGRTIGRLHVVYHPQGTQYREFLTDELLPTQDASEVVGVAIKMQEERRASRSASEQQDRRPQHRDPSRLPQRNQKPRTVRKRPWWYTAPPRPASPARQRMVQKLQARFIIEGKVAA
jgi:hypothetical protein